MLNDHTWIFEAKTQLTDFYKIAKVDEDEFEKVLGLLETVNRAKPDRKVEAFLKGKGAEASA
mgnify:CR=1 FL=1